MKFYFAGKNGIRGTRKIVIKIYLKPRNPELASLKTFKLLLKY